MQAVNEWEDNGVFEEGSEDTRPAWAKRIQGYHCNWAQIDRILSVVGRVSDNANVSIKTRPVRFGDKSYVVYVYVEGIYAGTYSY